MVAPFLWALLCLLRPQKLKNFSSSSSLGYLLRNSKIWVKMVGKWFWVMDYLEENKMHQKVISFPCPSLLLSLILFLLLKKIYKRIYTYIATFFLLLIPFNFQYLKTNIITQISILYLPLGWFIHSKLLGHKFPKQH